MKDLPDSYQPTLALGCLPVILNYVPGLWLPLMAVLRKPCNDYIPLKHTSLLTPRFTTLMKRKLSPPLPIWQKGLPHLGQIRSIKYAKEGWPSMALGPTLRKNLGTCLFQPMQCKDCYCSGYGIRFGTDLQYYITSYSSYRRSHSLDIKACPYFTYPQWTTPLHSLSLDQFPFELK
jgi:hypothetical protein